MQHRTNGSGNVCHIVRLGTLAVLDAPTHKQMCIRDSIYAGSCHNPQTWLLNSCEVVVAVTSDVVGFHEDIVLDVYKRQVILSL